MMRLRLYPILLVIISIAIYFIASSISLVNIKPIPYTTPRICEKTSSDRQKKSAPEIVVYVPTPILWIERRHIVLEQFRRELPLLHNAHLIFVLGTKQGPYLEEEAHGIAAARREAAKEEDFPRIRYLFTACRDLGDEPHNPNGTSSTSCKVYEALRHIVAFYDAAPPRYVWRGADDAYLDLTVFSEHVAPVLQTCRLFMGRLRFPSPTTTGDYDLDLPSRHPELYALFGLNKFGKYMVGMGYCMSWDVARFIGAASIPPRLTWCEDIMVSHWLLFYDVDFVDLNSAVPGVRMVHADEDKSFVSTWLSSNPTHRVLLAHRMTQSQWGALALRPLGDQSAFYLVAH